MCLSSLRLTRAAPYWNKNKLFDGTLGHLALRNKSVGHVVGQTRATEQTPHLCSAAPDLELRGQ